jgi:hypothetical protein
MEKEKYLKIIDILADKIYMMELETKSLKYANERMEKQIKELEAKLKPTQPLKEANNEI